MAEYVTPDEMLARQARAEVIYECRYLLKLRDQEIERLRAGLERVEGMAERPVCVCGVPTGTAAIKQAARAALAPPKPR